MATYQSWRDALNQTNFTTGSSVNPRTVSALREGELNAMYENALNADYLQQEQDAIDAQNSYWNGSLELQAAGLEQTAAQNEAMLKFYYDQLAQEQKLQDAQMGLSQDAMAAQEQANMIQGGIGLAAAVPGVYAMGKGLGLWGAKTATDATTGAVGGNALLGGESALGSTYGAIGGDTAFGGGQALTAAENAFPDSVLSTTEMGSTAPGWSWAGAAAPLAIYEAGSLLSGGKIPGLTEIPGLMYDAWFGDKQSLTPEQVTGSLVGQADYMKNFLDPNRLNSSNPVLAYQTARQLGSIDKNWLGEENVNAINQAYGDTLQTAADFVDRNSAAYRNYENQMAYWDPMTGGPEPQFIPGYDQALTSYQAEDWG